MDKLKPKTVVGIIIGVLLLIILLQNTEVVSFRVLFWKFSMSRIILLPLVLLSGVVIGYILGRRSKYY